VEQVATDAVAVLVALRPVVSKLAGLTAPCFAAAADDIEAHLVRLVYPAMATGVGAERLGDIARYLRAIERRIDRLPDNVARDADATAQARELERDLDAVIGTVGLTAEAEEAVWLLQELRVSLFAQTVGVKGNVSAKRVRSAIAKARTTG
jgi:ATP-dependent helicase HrpA